ncbi:MAG: ABC transporter ATP-binding protein [Clostridia bacterium]
MAMATQEKRVDSGNGRKKSDSTADTKQGKSVGGPRGPRTPVPSLFRLLSHMRPYAATVAAIALGVVFSTALGLLPPWLIRYGTDNLILAGRADGLLLVGLLMIAAVLLQGLLDFTVRYGSELVAQSVIHDLRSKLYAHLHRLSFAFFDESRTGDIMSRVTADADSLRQFFSSGIIYISGNVLTIIGVLIVMLIWEPRLALLYVLMLPLMAHAMAMYATRVRPLFGRVRRQLAKLTRVVQEDTVGVEVIKLFGREDLENRNFAQENDRYVKVNVDTARVTALWMPYASFLLGLATALTVWYGGYLVISDTVSMGTLVGFTGYISMLMRPIRQTGMMISFGAQAVAAGERIFDILDIEPDIEDSPDAIDLPPVDGHVEYRNVSFSYSPGNPVLEDISFVAEPGETIAVVGPTGAGKTTLVHLLPRFYDPDSGTILLDGHDLREVTLSTLRGQVGILMQHTFLFGASIRENISYGKPQATMDRVIECAKIAQLHDFITSLPLGYETPVGERGVTLSGGQRQRLAMARVLLTDPRLLILDEPTSSVDAETERQMQRALAGVMRDRTTFVIAHRLWTVRNADRIIVLDRGRIAEMGTHDELVASDGFYSEIYRDVLSGVNGEDDEA